MLDNLLLFTKIVECGNFSRASEILNIYKSKIHRRMEILEDELGVQLFKRNVSKMELTENGISAYNTFKSKLSILENQVDYYKSLTGKIEGQINVILSLF